MQWSGQKRGEVGLEHASPEFGLRASDVFKGFEEVTHEGIEIVRASVGQRGLGQGPDALIRVQLGGVGGEAFQVEAGKPAAEPADGLAPMRAPIVPEDNDVPAQVPEEVAQERAGLRLLDVLQVPLVVQAEAPMPRADGHPGDDGELVAPRPVPQHRSLPARGPGLAHGRDQQEPRLVYEDEVGPQPCRVFFTWGQRVRFQCSIAASSRSRARRSGF